MDADKTKPWGWRVDLLCRGKLNISQTEVLLRSEIRDSLHQAWDAFQALVSHKMLVESVEVKNPGRGFNRVDGSGMQL